MAANKEESFFAVIKKMDALRKNGHHDVIIYVGEKEFPCHRHLVAAACPTLSPMLLQENWQSEKPKVEGVDEHTFEMILNYIYSGNIETSAENGYTLLKAADYLDMGCLVTELKKYLKTECPTKDLLNVYNLAVHLNDAQFITALLLQIAKKLKVLYDDKIFLQFSYETINSILIKKMKIISVYGDKYLLCCDNFSSYFDSKYPTCSVCKIKYASFSSHKDDIFPTITKWTHENVIERIDHFHSLAGYTDLPLQFVDGWKSLFDRYRIELKKQVEENVSLSKSKLFLHIMNKGEIETLMKFSRCKEWTVTNRFPSNVSSLKTATKNRKIYYLSYDQSNDTNSFFCGDKEGSMNALCPVPVLVSDFKITSTSDAVYLYNYSKISWSVLEAKRNRVDISDMYSYVDDKDIWLSMPCSPKQLANSYFVSSKNTVYLIGGTSKLELTCPFEKVVQRYDPRASKWDVICPSTEIDLLLNGAACVYEDKIYVYSKVANSVVDAEKNKFRLKFYEFDIRVNKWKMEDLKIGTVFEPTVLVPFEKQLWAFGQTVKNGLMIFDVAANKWSEQEVLHCDLQNVDECVVKDGSVVEIF